MNFSSDDPNKLPLPYYYGPVNFIWLRLTGHRDEYGRKAQFIGWATVFGLD